MKRWAAISGIVGFVSTTVGLVQAFSFTHLEKVECHYSDPSDNDSDMMECLHDLNARVGQVVLLDWQTYVGQKIIGYQPGYERQRPFERRTGDGFVGWQFEGCTFTAEINRECAFTGDQYDSGMATAYWSETARMLEARFSNGRISWDKMPFPDNGLSVRIRGNGQSVNPYSNFEENTEGADIAQGPYQISMSNRDANFILWLSPAPMTDSLASHVRCARRDWPQLVKFFVCPFA